MDGEKPNKRCVKCNNYFKNDKTICTMYECDGWLVPTQEGLSIHTLDEKENPTHITIQDLSSFRDFEGTIYVTDGQKQHPIDGRRGKYLLAEKYRQQHKVTFGDSVFEKFKTEAGIDAQNKPAIKLSLRVAKKNNIFYWDLSNDDCTCVELTPTSWKTVVQPQIFKRYEHQRPMTIEAGKQADLDSYVAKQKLENRNQELLKKVYLVTTLIPEIPKTIKISQGDQGGAKTTADKADRLLLDDSMMRVLSLPKEHDNIIQMLDHNYCTYFDNVSSLSPDVQDIFCKAATGDATAVRELYTVDGDKIREYIRALGANGINIPATRADFLDRAIIFRYGRIKESDRKPEQEIISFYENLAPKVRGRIATIICVAMANYETVKAEFSGLTRMADFCVWGETIARIMGYQNGEFIRAYKENNSTANSEVLEASDIVSALSDFITKDGWNGTMSELLPILKTKAEALGIRTGGQKCSWPQKPASLGLALARVKTNLIAAGWVFEENRKNTGRFYFIKPPQGDGNGDGVTAGVNLLSPIFTSKSDEVTIVTVISSPWGKEEVIIKGKAKPVTPVTPSPIDAEKGDGSEKPTVTLPSQVKILIKFIKDCPEILSNNLTTIGAFKAGQIVTLSKEDAALLLERGFVEYHTPLSNQLESEATLPQGSAKAAGASLTITPAISLNPNFGAESSNPLGAAPPTGGFYGKNK